jgi:hypothetical protein
MKHLPDTECGECRGNVIETPGGHATGQHQHVMLVERPGERGLQGRRIVRQLQVGRRCEPRAAKCGSQSVSVRSAS